MATVTTEKPAAKTRIPRKLLMLLSLFALILVCILLIRAFPEKESEYVDEVAGQIRQEMEENQMEHQWFQSS